MFRPIRRVKNEISAEASEKLLHEARRGILAVNGDDGYPYAIPVNYYYDEKARKLFFHSSRMGHKADAIEKCGKVCFTVVGNEAIKAEPWAPYLQSVVVFGRCHPIADAQEASAMLKRFAMKYYPDEESVKEEIARSGAAARMYEIEIEHMSGKEVQER